MPKEEACLVIVESASKAKTIQGYLARSEGVKAQYGNGPWTVMASLGHLLDLPTQTMGVDTVQWTAHYELNASRRALATSLKRAAKGARWIFLAADPDREGEAIAYHLKKWLATEIPEDRMIRVAFHEITPGAIETALLNPKGWNHDLLEAQEARRFLDRVVGYESSPLLWRRFPGGATSAGRVQSAALKLLVDRHRALLAHTYTPVWRCKGMFRREGWGTFFPAVAHRPAMWDTWASVQDSARWLSECHRPPFAWTSAFEFKEGIRRPPPPLTTSAMQQEAAAHHGMSLDTTMRLAQELYEAGYITYMRTDSTTLSKTAQSAIHQWIQAHYGENFLQSRQYKTKIANAQEAHEAIRPTHIEKTVETLGDKWTPGHQKLYSLIWRRAVASQIIDARLRILKYTFTLSSSSSSETLLVFKGSDEVLLEPGFLTVLQPSMVPDREKEAQLAKLQTEGSAKLFPKTLRFEGDVVRPEPLFQEATLVKLLEKKGIGRPSTFAPILKKLGSKGYMIKGTSPFQALPVSHWTMEWDIEDTPTASLSEEVLQIGGQEKNALVPTPLGEKVIGYLEEILPTFIEDQFTAKMEGDLDRISRGEVSKTEMLTQFYQSFHPAVEAALTHQATMAKTTKTAKTAKTKTLKKAQTDRAPSTILKTFDALGAKVVQTRYGPALYIEATKSFMTLDPFLQWRQKTIEALNETDARFLKNLPQVHPDAIELHWGRYGLYVKKDGKNQTIDRSVWNAVYDGTYTPDLLQTSLTSLGRPGWKRRPKKP